MGASRLADGQAPPGVDSVVLEIGKEPMGDLIGRRPEMAGHMSGVLAERQMRNDEKLRNTAPARLEPHRASLSHRIADRIVRFFGPGH